MTAWTETADVVVLGFGYAGGVAAIEAHDAGADVLVLEKMPTPGGISVCSAGGVRFAENAEEAYRYLAATNAGTTPEPVLRALARGMTELPAYVRRLAADEGAEIEVREAAGNYPFAGHRTFGFVMVSHVPNFDATRAFPDVRGSPAGARLFKVVFDNVARRRIRVRTEAPAERLIVDGDGAVVGVALGDGRRIAARRAVVLATGGFEADAEMQRQFWQVKPVLSAAYRGNTGDGIRMAQAVGAQLWHMWHFHGSYGFRHPDPDYPFGIRMKRLPDWLPGEGAREDVRMAWILVDAAGRRFMNEYDPYMQDTGHRAMEYFDPLTQSYPRVPARLIVDEAGRRLYPLGAPTWNDAEVARDHAFAWSRDNTAELADGLLVKADTLAALARRLRLPADGLAATAAAWNAACAAGRDDAFGRPGSSMMPIVEPPFWGAEVWPIVSNTQGGPAHDADQRVLDVFGKPIARLFKAGEMGSVFGHLYMSGGNLAECFVGGRIAGRGAAAMPPWSDGAGS